MSLVLLLAVGLAEPPKYIPDADLGGRCLSCHAVGPTEFSGRSKGFVLLEESRIWHGHDLHRRAFDALKSDLGRRIGERLPGKPDVTTLPACLVCHATDTRPGTPLTDNPPGRFACDFGVNCQACHGPGDGWNGKHQAADWRTTPPAAKAALGLVNLRDPAVRADTCVSCHVGDPAVSRFVTHAMYAAGHPPLPAFELASFSRDEPKHWKPAAEVPPIAGLDSATARALFSHRPGEVETARLAAAGAVASLRQTAKLAAAAPPGPLDFAHFNCSACHHELTVPSDRQRHGFPGVAGRPLPTTWPVWLTRAVLQLPGVEAEAGGFDAVYAEYGRAFDARPFGDRDKVTAAAGKLAAACDAIGRRLEDMRFDPAAARALLASVAKVDGRGYLDFDAASHLGRAAASIVAELGEPAGDELERLIGLRVRPAGDNKTLLHAGGVYADRAERAFRFRVRDFREAVLVRSPKR